MKKSTEVTLTFGFDDTRIIGSVKINDVDPAMLALHVLSPVVKVLPSGKIKVLGYGLIPMGQIPSANNMRKKLREAGADL